MKGYRLDGYVPMTQKEMDDWDEEEERLSKTKIPPNQYNKDED